MNKIINIILSGLLWRKYKFLIVSLIVLVVFNIVVGRIHNDYLSYVESTGDIPNVGLSFVVKWALWIIAVLVFWALNHWVNKKKEQKDLLKAKNKSFSNIVASKFRKTDTASEQTSGVGANESKVDTKNERDPFAHIRSKDKLDSYADMVIKNVDKH